MAKQGRKKIYDKAFEKAICIRFESKDVFNRLRHAAVDQETSVPVLLGRIVEEYLGK